MRKAIITLILLAIAVPIGFQAFGESTFFTSYLANSLFHHNFHEVVPGRIFRSAQMSREDLGQVIEEHGIKSVVDLRLDDDTPDNSGITEEAAAIKHGAVYKHIPFSSSRADQRDSVLKLLNAYDELPQPILVHCSSGTHRSGVAAAIWLIQKEQRSPEEARQQLTMKYGFFQLERDMKAFVQRRPTLDKILVEYEKAKTDSGIDFRDWISQSKLLGPLPGRNTPAISEISIKE